MWGYGNEQGAAPLGTTIYQHGSGSRKETNTHQEESFTLWQHHLPLSVKDSFLSVTDSLLPKPSTAVYCTLSILLCNGLDSQSIVSSPRYAALARRCGWAARRTIDYSRGGRPCVI